MWRFGIRIRSVLMIWFYFSFYLSFYFYDYLRFNWSFILFMLFLLASYLFTLRNLSNIIRFLFFQFFLSFLFPLSSLFSLFALSLRPYRLRSPQFLQFQLILKLLHHIPNSLQITHILPCIMFRQVPILPFNQIFDNPFFFLYKINK